MYKLFKKIYTNKITSPGKTEELLGFMSDTDIEDRIPEQLPTSARVYHKTGDAVGSLHDVGIIVYEDKPYFLAVMTSDIGNAETATRGTISEIAKNITRYRDARR